MKRGVLTQKERVLRALRSSRGRGICAVDFLAPNVIDGGAPILRVPARVDELRKDGHHIQIAGRRNDCVIYVLSPPAEAWQPIDQEPAPAAEDASSVASLFDPHVGRPAPTSPYDTGGGRAA